MATTGKVLNHLIKKFMTAEVCKEARVQIELPNGELYDFTGMQLLENVIIGDNETHRLVIIDPSLAASEYPASLAASVLVIRLPSTP